jgi:hypothetical protein
MSYKWLVSHGVFVPSLVLRLISKYFRKWADYSQDIDLPIVIVFDEMQNIYQRLKDERLYRVCKHVLAEYMCNSNQANKNSQADRLLIIPAYAGTLTPNMVLFDPTDYDNHLLPLPPLVPLDVKNTIQALCHTKNINYEQLAHPWLWRYFLVLGSVPRHLNVAFDTTISRLKEYKIPICDKIVDDIIFATDDSIHAMIKKDDQETYTGSVEHDRELVDCVLSGRELNKEIPWVSRMIIAGKLYFSDSNVYLPHRYFLELLCEYMFDTLHLLNYIPNLQNQVDWEQFKIMDLTALALRINGMVTSQKVTFSVSDLFPGCVFNDSVQHPIVKLQKVTVEYLAENLLNDGSKKSFKTTNGNVTGKSRYMYVFKAEKGQEAADGVLFLRNADTNEKDVAVFIQYNCIPTTLATWYKNMEEVVGTKYKDCHCYYVYSCNYLAPKSTENPIARNGCENIVVLYIDKMAAETPNMRPLYSSLIVEQFMLKGDTVLA